MNRLERKKRKSFNEIKEKRKKKRLEPVPILMKEKKDLILLKFFFLISFIQIVTRKNTILLSILNLQKI